MKLILTDIDDTILKFADPFQAFVEQKGYAPSGRLADTYGLEAWLGVDSATVRDLLIEFGTVDASRVQPPMSCAQRVLPGLYAAGYRFIGISACGTNEAFRLRRLQTLHEAFGFRFEALHVVSPHAAKEDYLRWYAPAIWVEDHPRHAVVGADAGHRVFLIDRPFNAGFEHPKVTRVADWNEIREHLE